MCVCVCVCVFPELLEVYRLKMAKSRARIYVSRRLASEIVTGENRLVKLCNAILASRA